MGTDIEAAANAPALGTFAGGAIADAALRLEGAVVGVVSVAAAGLAALLGETGPAGGNASSSSSPATWTGGGGHIDSPSRATVMPRTTTSSRSRTSSPSLPGVISLRRLTTLVP